MTLQVAAPVPLLPTHRLDDFSCGEPVLDDWLKRRALGNQLSGASRTFVAADPTKRVLGYYALAAGAVTHASATGSVRRNMPDPVPVLVLGRLAVDQRAKGQQLGSGLLKDSVHRALAVAQNAGVRALLVHALNEPARQFYLKYGFQQSPVEGMTLMLRLGPVGLG
jgi:GNAT superfamily N-acetyltransferase